VLSTDAKPNGIQLTNSPSLTTFKTQISASVGSKNVCSKLDGHGNRKFSAVNHGTRRQASMTAAGLILQAHRSLPPGQHIFPAKLAREMHFRRAACSSQTIVLDIRPLTVRELAISTANYHTCGEQNGNNLRTKTLMGTDCR
jgi:hypothetical protein